MAGKEFLDLLTQLASVLARPNRIPRAGPNGKLDPSWVSGGTPGAHAATHSSGGSDAVDVKNLAGYPNDATKVLLGNATFGAAPSARYKWTYSFFPAFDNAAPPVVGASYTTHIYNGGGLTMAVTTNGHDGDLANIKKMIRIKTSGVANNVARAKTSAHNSYFYRFAKGRHFFRFRTGPDAGDIASCIIFAGFANSGFDPGDLTHAFGVEYDPANSANWRALAMDGAARTYVDSGIAAAINQNLELELDFRGTPAAILNGVSMVPGATLPQEGGLDARLVMEIKAKDAVVRKLCVGPLVGWIEDDWYPT